MSTIPDSINRLIEEFARFPGIGRKTAQRMVFHVLKSPNDHAVELAESVMDMKQKFDFAQSAMESLKKIHAVYVQIQKEIKLQYVLWRMQLIYIPSKKQMHFRGFIMFWVGCYLH